MACFVPGCSTGGAGVLRSAWMLYHFDGMSFSSRRNFVRFLSVVLAAMPTSLIHLRASAGGGPAPPPPGARRAPPAPHRGPTQGGRVREGVATRDPRRER